MSVPAEGLSVPFPVTTSANSAAYEHLVVVSDIGITARTCGDRGGTAPTR